MIIVRGYKGGGRYPVQTLRLDGDYYTVNFAGTWYRFDLSGTCLRRDRPYRLEWSA